MTTTESVTEWIGQIRAGNRDAVTPLWERYFSQLVRLSKSRLAHGSRRLSDEEDVALSSPLKMSN